MPNNYYNFTPSFVPGTKVRSDEMNTQLAGIETAFDSLPGDTTSLARGTNILGTESGSGNTYVLTMGDTRASYQGGDRFVFRATHTNTAASTINVDGLGALSLVTSAGDAIAAGDVESGLYYQAVYDSTSNAVQLLGSSSNASLYAAYAEEWAVKAEDSLISTAAGGDGVTDYSSLHWAAKAAASAVTAAAAAASVSLPSIAGNALKYLRVNAGETALEYHNLLGSSNTWTQTQTFGILTKIEAAVPRLRFTETGAAADNGSWDITGGASEAFKMRAINDALNDSNDFLSVERTGIVIDSVILGDPDGGHVTIYPTDVFYNTTTGDGTSLIVAAASTTVAGKIELATQTEVNTGTDAVRAVTPATLASWSGLYTLPAASETVVGGVELATQAEVDAGTDTGRVVTPATLTNWAGLVTDHGALSGLTDDDHTMYFRADGARTLTGLSLTWSATSNTFNMTSTAGVPTINMRSDTSGGGIIKFLNSAVVEASIGMNGTSDDLELINNISGADNYLRLETDGTLSIAPGTGNYEDLVTADDDIPNKRYTDDHAGRTINRTFGDGNQLINNTTTYANDNAMSSMTLVANGVYKVDMRIPFLTATATMGLKVRLNASAGSIDDQDLFGTLSVHDSTTGAQFADWNFTSTEMDIAPTYTATTKDSVLHVSGIILAGVSGATVEVQYAQNTAIASDLTILEGAYLTYTRLS